MVYIISIEGNIGSGKTTFLKKLKDYYKDNKNVCFLEEPVNTWMSIKDKEGNDILSKFYGDIKKYAFSFQMMAYISRVSILRNEIKKNPDRIFITERSILTDKNVFAQMLYDDEMIEEVDYQIYMKWFNEFNDLNENLKIVYVNTNPEICFERIKKRNRKGEDVKLDYLIRCDDYHKNWLLKLNNLKILDGDVDKSEDDYVEWLNILDMYVNI